MSERSRSMNLSQLEKTLKILEKYGVTEYQSGELKLSITPKRVEDESNQLMAPVYRTNEDLEWAHAAD